jgi:hypothetical protein
MSIPSLELPSQSSLLIEIENLVKDIAKGLSALVSDKIIKRLSTYLSVYQPDYDYSEYVEAFWFGCNQVGVLTSGYLGNSEQLSRLIQIIADYTKRPMFKRRVSDRRYQTKQNAKRIEDYAQSLHQQYARLLVIRVDLGYRTDNQPLIDVDRVYQHLDKINKIRYTHSLFTHLVGSAWCLEQGITKGYHIHAVYYFKGSEHHFDGYMAQQIGELWQKLTDVLGTYHSCNTKDEKDKYDKQGKLGIGMIRRNDSVACENSINAVGYLADSEKEDQYLRMKPKRRREFGTGLMEACVV